MNNLYRANFNARENRGANAPQKKKINFNQMKDNTIQSLNEIECFLCNLNHFWKYVKLYKIFK